MYATELLGIDLDATVYALDSTTIDLCLAVFPWAHFRKETAAVKMHTLLDLRGPIPTFIEVSDGKRHDVHLLDDIAFEPGAFKGNRRPTGALAKMAGTRDKKLSVRYFPSFRAFVPQAEKRTPSQRTASVGMPRLLRGRCR